MMISIIYIWVAMVTVQYMSQIIVPRWAQFGSDTLWLLLQISSVCLDWLGQTSLFSFQIATNAADIWCFSVYVVGFYFLVDSWCNEKNKYQPSFIFQTLALLKRAMRASIQNKNRSNSERERREELTRVERESLRESTTRYHSYITIIT